MTLLDHFKKFYDVKRAFSPQDLEQCYRIRHSVFCRELNYFDADDYEMEVDEYDAHSEHALLLHKPSGRAVACARIIGGSMEMPEKQLPYETVFKDHLNRELFDPDVFLPGKIIEFSRLAVLPEFRGQVRRDATLPENADLLEACKAPVVLLGLFSICVSLFVNSEAEYGAAMMEPRLAQLIKHSGFKFEEIGDPVKHCGWRSPFLFEREVFMRNISREVSDLFREIDQRLCEDKANQLLPENGVEKIA
ncbi:PEP-CTERM/exosortase system-associated acyltransferase [uncultured Pseudoteredinibacter sp.]|uniref:PEP-CTERM/exosortase system-associated acyltransferase n=1 Tax=uncultured Pseudoteredinibacter sp. TaxID=1641701 RepID=UPI002622FE15|nr:PEP-CTERM/exosortase system-associated acyltransferase [uncultured Pseudoteredinibacter sp.]